MTTRLLKGLELTSVQGLMETCSFGKIPIPPSQIFAKSSLSFAFTNIRPFLPGHSLVSPLRVVKRFKDMTSEELVDFFAVVQVVAEALELRHDGTASSIIIQDGEAAGQTIPHVHAHIIPRRANDLERPDSIYEQLENADKPNRTMEEMTVTADEIRPFIDKVFNEKLVACLREGQQ
ncbi:bis(5'-adenosyl)-triphosphatase like protein [Babesia gibsoni]|uniref:Bis(5'-adenosyl)-triphosphatase n=1 Tax=Babesia gibsoni TaxID=33632 RepID=A0AAD8PCS9_BABGI|nr:bis(5'-adenosyl)-triphosphatase like protein [Babesia gibsoni]